MVLWISKNWRVLFVNLILCINFGIIGYFLYYIYANDESKLQEATSLSQEQATTINSVQNELNINNQNAELTVEKIFDAVNGVSKPTARFVVESSTVEQASKDVAEKINKKDNTLPPQALEKTDRTISVAQKVKQPDGTKQWEVGIYKINNYRNWEFSTGLGWNKGEAYVPFEIQRNYSKDHALSVEVHIQYGTGIKGGEIKYTVKKDSLF